VVVILISFSGWLPCLPIALQIYGKYSYHAIIEQRKVVFI